MVTSKVFGVVWPDNVADTSEDFLNAKAPYTWTKPNTSSSALPLTSSSTVWSIVSVTSDSSLPTPATSVQSRRPPPAGPLFTCTSPETVKTRSAAIPTRLASVRLTCRPVYLFAGVSVSFTSTKSRELDGTLKPTASAVTTVANESSDALSAPPTPTNPPAVSDRLKTSALNSVTGPAGPSSIATSVCLTRSNEPANTTKPNIFSATLPSRIASLTVWSIVRVTAGKSVPAPVTADQSRRPAAGPLFTCTSPETVSSKSPSPTRPALITLACKPVYLFALVIVSCTITRSRDEPLDMLKPIAPVVTTVAEESFAALNAPPTPTKPPAVRDRLRTSAVNGPVRPSSIATSVCFTRSNEPANTTKSNTFSAASPLTASFTVSSIAKVASGSSLPGPVTADQSKRPAAGPLFTCTAAETVNSRSVTPTSAVLFKLACKPVYLFALVVVSCTINRSKDEPLDTLKPIASVITTFAEESFAALNAPPAPTNPPAVNDTLRTSAVNAVNLPSSIATPACFTRSNEPDSTTKSNTFSAALPL